MSYGSNQDYKASIRHTTSTAINIKFKVRCYRSSPNLAYNFAETTKVIHIMSNP